MEKEKAAKAAAAKAKADAEALANKKSKSQRIEEHREAARRRMADEEDDESSEEDEADKKARLRKSEKEADLTHAQDLLGNVGLGPAKGRTAGPNKATIIEDTNQPGQAIDLSKLPLFRPNTKTQFENLTATLTPLITASATKPHYSLWLTDFVKKISAEMPSSEIKKAASALTTLSNEKMKEEKASDKAGKKTKAAKSKNTLAAGRDVGRGVADTTSYGDELGDDDFM